MRTNTEPIEPIKAVVEYWALDKAFHRHIFRNPNREGQVFATLPQYEQNCIVKEALEIGGAK